MLRSRVWRSCGCGAGYWYERSDLQAGLIVHKPGRSIQIIFHSFNLYIYCQNFTLVWSVEQVFAVTELYLFVQSCLILRSSIILLWWTWIAYLALKATNLLVYSIPFRIPFGYVAKASFVVFVLLTQSTFIQYLNSFIEQLSLPTLRHWILYSHLITRFRWTNFPSATCMKFKDGREKQKPQIGRPWTCKYCRWKSKHWRNYTIAGSQHHNHDLDATAARSLTLCQISDEVCSFVRPFGGLTVIELSTAIVAFQSIPTFILEESGCMISSLVDSTTLPSFTRARISSIRRHNGNFSQDWRTIEFEIFQFLWKVVLPRGREQRRSSAVSYLLFGR